MTSNQVAYWNLREQERANRVTESETQRHNKTEEAIKSYLADLNAYATSHNVRANMANAITGGIKNLTGAISSVLDF